MKIKGLDTVPAVFSTRIAPLLSRAVVLVALLPIGCGDRDRSANFMIPDSGTARRAIGIAMDSWRAGRPTGAMESSAPRVLIVDSFRRPGQTLDHYEILGDTVDGKTRDITVRVSLAGPEAIETLRFKTVGLDPVVVFRKENYEMIAHWDHNMGEETEATSPTLPAEEVRP